jgi:hypothetical protein
VVRAAAGGTHVAGGLLTSTFELDSLGCAHFAVRSLASEIQQASEYPLPLVSECARLKGRFDSRSFGHASARINLLALGAENARRAVRSAPLAFCSTA